MLPVDIDTMHFPPIACSVHQDGSSGDRVPVPPTDSMFCAVLREMQRNPLEAEQNVSLQMFYCPYGEYHVR